MSKLSLSECMYNGTNNRGTRYLVSYRREGRIELGNILIDNTDKTATAEVFGEIIALDYGEFTKKTDTELCSWIVERYNYNEECEDEDDGQPSEYEEWQDFMGGDDWDHGQYD